MCCRLFNPGVLPIRIYTGASARNGDPFRPQVHEKAGMLLVLEYMEGKKILSYRFVKRPEGLSEAFYGCEKVVKIVPVLLFIHISKKGNLQKLKE